MNYAPPLQSFSSPPTRPDMVTSVIRHEVETGKEREYETWLQRIIPVAASFPGHRGVDVIPPPSGSQTYTIAIRFDALACAQAWFASAERKALVDEVESLLKQSEEVNTITGLEFWFEHPKGPKHPRPVKQFLLTLSVIYPLTVLVPPIVHFFTAAVPVLMLPLVHRLIVAAIIVGLMTYVIMPRYTRLVARWLYR